MVRRAGVRSAPATSTSAWRKVGAVKQDRNGGSVSTRASKYSLCSRTGGDVPSRGFQDVQHRHGAAEELESVAIGGNVLMVTGARAEEVAQFIVSPAEPGGRSGALEAPHGPVAA